MFWIIPLHTFIDALSHWLIISEEAAVDSFRIDLGDNRFSALLARDGRFGIDPTSSEYRATPALQTILKEQRKRVRKDETVPPVE